MPKITIPENLMCPVTVELFNEPVIASDGYTYEKQAIQEILKRNGLSPITRESLSQQLIPHREKKEQIADFLKTNCIVTLEEFSEAVNEVIRTYEEQWRDKNFSAFALKSKESIEQAIYLTKFAVLAKPYLLSSLDHLKALNYLESYLEAENHTAIARDLMVTGVTIIQKAASSHCLELVSWLSEEGANLKARSGNGVSILHLVSDIKIAEFLLARGVDVNTQDNKGNTPLHFAASRLNYEMIQWLLRNNANSTLQNHKGQTPYDHIEEHNVCTIGRTHEVLESLYLFKAHFIHQQNPGDYNSEFHLSIQYGLAKVKALVHETWYEEQGTIDLSAKNEQGETPLHVAIRLWREDIVEYLLSRDNPYLTDLKHSEQTKENETLLHYAARSSLAIFNKILNLNRFNLDYPDHNGNTALHIAVRAGKFEIVEKLLNRGANCQLKNKEGQTALQIAQESKDKVLFSFIQRYVQLERIPSLEKIVHEQEKSIQALQQEVKQLTLLLKNLPQNDTPSKASVSPRFLK